MLIAEYAHFYLAPDLQLEYSHSAEAAEPWEVFQGRLLEPRFTRQQRSFESWNLHVIDQGVGIAHQDQSRLFTRFGRIENPETRHTAGTGLGLWLSREIARMHDGDLTLDSEAGKGSTFTLEIPVAS